MKPRSGYAKRYENEDLLTFFNFLAASQNVACYRFLHILMESEQNYFHRNLGYKWPATVVNKQLFGSNNIFSL